MICSIDVVQIPLCKPLQLMHLIKIWQKTIQTIFQSTWSSFYADSNSLCIQSQSDKKQPHNFPSDIIKVRTIWASQMLDFSYIKSPWWTGILVCPFRLRGHEQAICLTPTHWCRWWKPTMHPCTPAEWIPSLNSTSMTRSFLCMSQCHPW